ncbi:MAG: hypothetical protein A2X37_11330 [Elusimicrobia bacterium GWA2_66_18]|nr:MAG: hypothetical protein A2X37_11330 [Elusimicrobia bacterium GWA2_66_18]
MGIGIGLFLYELLSGAVVTLWPGLSAWLQFGVLLHTALGLVFIAPFAVYAWTHAWRANNSSERLMVWIGYAALAAVSLSGLTGLWAAWTAAFGELLPDVARWLHRWSSYAAAALVVYHLAKSILRLSGAALWPSSTRTLLAWAGAGCGMLVVMTLALAAAYQPTIYKDGPPAGYSFRFGPKPFAPSNATTASGGIIDSRRLSGSQGCGDCHRQIYDEWKANAHHWSSTDLVYRAVENMMIKKSGQEATRYCAACHDPVALLSGANTPGSSLDSPGSDEGSSCVACHGIRGLNGKTEGNGNYVFAPPRDYLFAGYPGRVGKKVNYFLLRALPRAHTEDLAKDFHGQPELCSACHKQFIDKEINHFGWVQLQNQYDDWRKGRYHVEGHPEKTLACKDCHMRLVVSQDPARGRLNDPSRGADGKHRSHRFIGANQAIPWLNKDAEQFKLTEEWLKGRSVVPEIQSRWAKGAAVPIHIDAPQKTSGRLKWQVIVTNNKAGHGVPTGPLDIIETWLEVKVLDADGKTIFVSGKLDAKNYVDKGAFFFRSRGVDENGALIDRHNLWDMVGQKTKRAIFVGYSDAAPYECALPQGTRGPLTITARLRYRKFNQFIADLATGNNGTTFPVTDLSEDQAKVDVLR